MISASFKKQNFDNKCLEDVPKRFTIININHIGVIYSQYPFGDTLSKKPASYRNQPTNLQCKSNDWFLYDTSPYQRCLCTGPSFKEF